MSIFFFGRKTTPELTLGLELTEQREKLLEERKKRWDLYIKDLSSTFIVDLKTLLKRDVSVNPEETKFHYDASGILADPQSYSNKLFKFIIGASAPKLLMEEGWFITHRTVREALVKEDVFVIIDDDNNGFTIDITDSKLLAKRRTEPTPVTVSE